MKKEIKVVCDRCDKELKAERTKSGTLWNCEDCNRSIFFPDVQKEKSK